MEWLEKPAESLTREHLAAILKGSSRSIARSIKAYGGAAFAWSMSDGAVSSNPFKDLTTRLATTERDRVLDDAEISRVWIAAGEIPSVYGPIVRVLLVTAQRRQEVAGMRWGSCPRTTRFGPSRVLAPRMARCPSFP